MLGPRDAFIAGDVMVLFFALFLHRVCIDFKEFLRKRRCPKVSCHERILRISLRPHRSSNSCHSVVPDIIYSFVVSLHASSAINLLFIYINLHRPVPFISINLQGLAFDPFHPTDFPEGLERSRTRCPPPQWPAWDCLSESVQSGSTGLLGSFTEQNLWPGRQRTTMIYLR